MYSHKQSPQQLPPSPPKYCRNSSMEDECRQAVASAMKALKSTAVSGSNTPLSTTVHFHVQMVSQYFGIFTKSYYSLAR